MYIALAGLVTILTLISILCRFRYRYSDRIFTFLFCMIISIILSFRSIGVPDTKEYIRIFEGIDVHTNYGFSLFRDNYQFGIEYGFIYWIKIFKTFISTDYHVFFTVTSLTILLLFINGSQFIINSVENKENQYTNISLMLASTISYFGLYYCGIAIRAGMALGVSLFAFGNAIKKNYIKSFICLIVSIMFHRLSIVIVIAYFVYLFCPKFEKKTFLFIWIISGILLGSNFSFVIMNFSRSILTWISSKFISLNYLHYVNNLETSVSIYAIILWLIGFSCSTLMYDKDEYASLFNVYWVGIIIISFLSAFSGYSRITDFFTVMNIPLLYVLIQNRNKLFSLNSLVFIVAILLNVYKVFAIYTQ